MFDGQIVWVVVIKAPSPPRRPVQMTVRRDTGGRADFWFYKADGGAFYAAKHPSFETEADALVGWRDLVCQYVMGRRLDDQNLIQEAFAGHPGALEWAESVTDTIKRLEAERDALRAKVADLEVAQVLADDHHAAVCVRSAAERARLVEELDNVRQEKHEAEAVAATLRAVVAELEADQKHRY